MQKKKYNRKGFSLIELIVTVALMAIVTLVGIGTYTNLTEEKRMETDLTNLNNIDTTLKQILMNDDAFEEVKTHTIDAGVDENGKDLKKVTLSIRFKVRQSDADHKKPRIVLSDAILNNNEMLPLETTCPITYEYLIGYIDDDIVLTSGNYLSGYYEITFEFNKIQVSEVREEVINNDVIITKNTGDEFLLDYRE